MRRPSRKSMLAGGLVLLIAASGLGVSAFGSRAEAEVGAGPVATATARDLRTTESVAGTLARADTKTLVYGGISGAGGNLRIATTWIFGPVQPDDLSGSEEGGPESCPSQSPSPSPTPSPSPADSPCPPSTPEPSPSPTPEPSPEPSPTPEPSPEPSPSPSPSPEPAPAAPQEPQPERTPEQAQDQRPAAVSGGGSNVQTRSPAVDAPEIASRAATLTGVMQVGSLADRGSVLYAADTEPVVALLAPEALFRDLHSGAADGDDIQALEENLSALGYGSGLTVDRHFDSATAAAVKRWEEDLKRLAPDGKVAVGEVVFIPDPAVVISTRAVVGDKLNIGTPVLTLGTQSRVVTAMVDVDGRGEWAAGRSVQLGWTDGPGTGTIAEVGRDEAAGQVGVTIALGEDAPDVPIGTEVEVSVTTAEKSGVVTVPVSAIVDSAGKPAVRLVGDGEDSLVPVELGVVSGGLVEVTKGLKEGAEVRLPG